MERTTQAVFTGAIGVIGAMVLLGLTVYPFQYGLVESSLLAVEPFTGPYSGTSAIVVIARGLPGLDC